MSPTRGDFVSIIRLAWPVFLGQLAAIAFGVVDIAMVARYSSEDLAALSMGHAVYISTYVGLIGVLQAITPVVAQLHGAQRHADIGEEIRQSAWLALGLAALGALIPFFPGPLLRISGAAPELLDKSRVYLLLLAAGLPGALAFRVYAALNTAVSRPLAVSLIQIGGLALKFPLSYLFIFGGFGLPAMGTAGCGLATTVISWSMGLSGLWLLKRGGFYAPFAIFARLTPPNFKAIGELLRLGLPIGVTQLIEVTSFTFMALFIARLGASTLAAHQIVANIDTVLYMLPLSLGIASSTLVAQAVGGHRLDEARRIGWNGLRLGLFCTLTLAVLIAVFKGALLSAYTPDPKVIAVALPLLGFIAFYQIVDGAQVIANFVLRAYKIAFLPMAVYAVSLWGIGLGGGYHVGLAWSDRLPAAVTGAAGFWLASCVSLGAAAVCLIGLLAWRTRQTD